MLSDSDQKKRLEHGVWLDEVERAFRIWRAAPPSEKSSHLLTGITLTWAESWRMTHPGDFSPATQTYIARSVAAQAVKASSEREKQDAETRRRDKVYQQILLLMALFAIVILAPGAMRLYIRAAEPLLPAEAPVSGQPVAAVIKTEVSEPHDATAPMELPEPVQQSATALTERAKLALRDGKADLAGRIALEALYAAPVDRLPADAASMLATFGATRRAATWNREHFAEFDVVRSCANGRLLVRSADRYLLAAPSSDGLTPLAERMTGGQVNANALDAGCQTALIASDDYDVAAIDTVTGAEQRKFGRHNAPIVDMRFSLDGKRVVSLARDGEGRIWDVASGRRVAAFRTTMETVTGAAVSGDGALALTWTDGGAAELWDATSGAARGKLEGSKSPLVSAVFSTDAKRLLAVSVDGTATVWDVATRMPTARLRPKDGAIVEATFATGERHIVARLDEYRLQVFDLDAGVDAAKAAAAVQTAEQNTVIALSPDNRLIAAADADGLVVAWDAANGAKRFQLRAGTPVLALTFKDEATLLAHGVDATVTWSLPTTRERGVSLANGASHCTGSAVLPWCGAASAK